MKTGLFTAQITEFEATAIPAWVLQRRAQRLVAFLNSDCPIQLGWPAHWLKACQAQSETLLQRHSALPMSDTTALSQYAQQLTALTHQLGQCLPMSTPDLPGHTECLSVLQDALAPVYEAYGIAMPAAETRVVFGTPTFSLENTVAEATADSLPGGVLTLPLTGMCHAEQWIAGAFRLLHQAFQQQLRLSATAAAALTGLELLYWAGPVVVTAMASAFGDVFPTASVSNRATMAALLRAWHVAGVAMGWPVQLPWEMLQAFAFGSHEALAPSASDAEVLLAEVMACREQHLKNQLPVRYRPLSSALQQDLFARLSTGLLMSCPIGLRDVNPGHGAAPVDAVALTWQADVAEVPLSTSQMVDAALRFEYASLVLPQETPSHLVQGLCPAQLDALVCKSLETALVHRLLSVISSEATPTLTPLGAV